MNFYRLNAELTALIRTIEDGEELTPELIAAVDAFNVKSPDAIESLCTCIREMNARATVNRSEAAWFTTAARRQEGASETFKELLLNHMLLMKLKDAKTERFSVTVQKGPPKLIVPAGFEPVQFIGTEYAGYVVTSHALDKDKVKTALKEGTEVPGGFKIAQDPYVKVAPR